MTSHHPEHEQQSRTDASQPPVQHTPEAPDAGAVSARRETGGGADAPGSAHLSGVELVAQGERDEFNLRLQHALNHFVDNPLRAVEEADTVFDDITTRLTDVLDERRRLLRASWQHSGTEAETEELRLALKQYRELAEGLLHSSAPAGR
ncbi:hypothetical protein PJ985_02500 [Streptomyces sp. ACA25]|uniref:hypothetical protein n=1 Tax=Streptomyces sp. ACA25 TaxID=3022596 RepID=UPI00230721E1|nr:hypothetical protein [Streptomyces sp. ACA25]MDB1086445.1 hypothetical protein [Streptomyces sp. ACA25]